MKAQTSSGAILLLVGGTIVLGLIYFIIGVFLSHYSTVIYEDIPNDDFKMSYSRDFEMRVHNNAPLNLPRVVPRYTGMVNILNSSNVICEVNAMGGDTPCEDISIDLGPIYPGESSSLYFSVDPHGENFTIKMATSLYGRLLFTKEKSYWCENTGSSIYNCRIED